MFEDQGQAVQGRFLDIDGSDSIPGKRYKSEPQIFALRMTLDDSIRLNGDKIILPDTMPGKLNGGFEGSL